MSSTQKIAVLGTTGGLGRTAIQKLSSANIPTRCLLRHSIPAGTEPRIDKDATSTEVAAYLASLPNVEMIQGDVTDKTSLETLMKGCTAVFALHGAKPAKPIIKSLIPILDSENDPSHPKMVNYVGIQNIIDVASKSDSTIKRIVRITGKGEDPFSFFSILINMLGRIAKGWNYEGEELLRGQTNVDYTIIRPGIMGRPDVPKGKVRDLSDNGGDLKVSAVSYEQIAELCIDCLEYENSARATLTAMNVDDGLGEETYAPLLEKVIPDSRIFPKSLLEEHKRGARLGGSIFLVFVTAVAYSVLGGISKMMNLF